MLSPKGLRTPTCDKGLALSIFKSQLLQSRLCGSLGIRNFVVKLRIGIRKFVVKLRIENPKETLCYLEKANRLSKNIYMCMLSLSGCYLFQVKCKKFGSVMD